MKLGKSIKQGVFELKGWRLYLLLLIAAGTTSCMTVQEATNRAINRAVGNAVERSVSNMLSGYSNMMLYQLAYTQAFHVGGFGIHPELFSEGEGTTWRIDAGDDDEMNSYTTERALLKRNEDGSSWWYLNYQPEGDETLEYEIKMNQNLEPLEMYMRNVNTGEIDHHIFDTADADGEEAWESEKELEEQGYHTSYFFLQDHEEYQQGTEAVRVGNRSYESRVLAYSGTEEEEDLQTDFSWWVSEDVPGHLVKYEITNRNDSGRATGELVEVNRNYQPKFVVL
ncbi:MAG: hypothetical protein WEA56_14750 [Balneolaceae bacterium]